MESVNALEIRQSLGRILRKLEEGGRPILVERRRRPAAVLVSLKDYQERFVDRDADEQRREVVKKLRALRFSGPSGQTTLALLRAVRSGGA